MDEELVVRTYKRFLNHGRRRCRNLQEAQDFASWAIIEYLENGKKYDVRFLLLEYWTKVWGEKNRRGKPSAKYLALSRMDSVDAQPELLRMLAMREVATADKIDVERMLEILTPRQREAIVRVFVLGELRTDVAAEWRVDPSTITYTIDAAVSRIRQHFGKGKEYNET